MSGRGEQMSLLPIIAHAIPCHPKQAGAEGRRAGKAPRYGWRAFLAPTRTGWTPRVASLSLHHFVPRFAPATTTTERTSCCDHRISIAASKRGQAREFEALAQPLNRLDLFSQAHDDLAASLYSDAFAGRSRQGRSNRSARSPRQLCWTWRDRGVHGSRPHLPNLGTGSSGAPTCRGTRTGADAWPHASRQRSAQ